MDVRGMIRIDQQINRELQKTFQRPLRYRPDKLSLDLEVPIKNQNNREFVHPRVVGRVRGGHHVRKYGLVGLKKALIQNGIIAERHSPDRCSFFGNEFVENFDLMLAAAASR